MANIWWCGVTLLALTWINITSAVTPSNVKPIGSNICASKETCHDCIQTPSCAWCSMPDFREERCFHPFDDPTLSSNCPEDYTINPENEYVKIRHKELTRGDYALDKALQEFLLVDSLSKQETVQLYPQEINLKLRINDVQKFKIEYAQAVDYPVDLYYLMDLSNSTNKQKLLDLGVLLAETMSNITSNFRLGFGSFARNFSVDDSVKPCDECAFPHVYKNHMPLSQNTQQFASLVRDTPQTFNNLDAAQVDFDAIMQAMVCTDEIGWRAKSRKFLLVATDANLPKPRGNVKVNDGQCHLDENGLYTHSTLQDHPTISQINSKANRNNINIIWAVTEKQIPTYNNLAKVIGGSYVAKLGDDSSNVVDFLRDEYNKISSTIEMADDSSYHVELKYYSSCLGGGSLVEKNKCEGLKVGDKVEFTVEVRVPACPAKRSDWNQTIHIKPIAVNESLIVNLETICDCGCERTEPGNAGFELKSEMCFGRGDLTCGICSCDENYFGERCECDVKDRGLYGCRKDNTSTVDCSGRGLCECNQCVCNERDVPEEVIYGAFCECNNFSCERRNKELCSGRDHGRCECGQCNCNPGWSGVACDCSTDTSKCFVGDVDCSGHGRCECGKCKCNTEGEHRYTGEFCEVCRTCPIE